MFDNLENLSRLVAVIDCGTLHGAADQLGVTQPAVSRSIKMLEISAGAPIFERRGRNVVLTPLGERFADHARAILRECELARTDFETLRAGESGTMRVGAAPVWMSSILPQVIAETQRAYPRLTIQLRSMSYSEGIPLLNNGEIDLFCGGFQRIEGLSSFLVRSPLFTSKLSVVARASHPVFGLEQVGAQDLLQYSWLSYQSDVAYLDMIMDAVLADVGQAKQASVQCGSMLTALELLRCGDYLAFLPGSFVVSNFGAGLRVVPTQIGEASFQSGVIARRSLTETASYHLFFDLIRDRIQVLGFQ